MKPRFDERRNPPTPQTFAAPSGGMYKKNIVNQPPPGAAHHDPLPHPAWPADEPVTPTIFGSRPMD
jgi:hypothetical protein